MLDREIAQLQRRATETGALEDKVAIVRALQRAGEEVPWDEFVAAMPDGETNPDAPARRFGSRNAFEVRHGPWLVLYSYSTPVAAIHQTHKLLIQTSEKYSHTTTKQMSQWSGYGGHAYDGFVRVSQDELERVTGARFRKSLKKACRLSYYGDDNGWKDFS